MYKFIDNCGTFELKNAGANSYLYFPICNEAGIMGSLTPSLGGDLMLDQNHFILQPASVEDLHNYKSKRNFWLRFEDGTLRSATGSSVWQKADGTNSVTVRAGLLWHEIETEIVNGNDRIEARVLNFAPAEDVTCEIMRVSLVNTGEGCISFDPVAVVPLYGRSATNLRDHRHVTSLLHRIKTVEYGVTVTPTLSFDERGHLKNTTEYLVAGCDRTGAAPKAFYPTVMSVIGEGGDFELPIGLKEAKGVGPGAAFEGVEAVGGLEFGRVSLKPGESAEYIIFIGARDVNDITGSAEDLMKRFGSSEAVERALENNKKYWIAKAKAGLNACSGAEKAVARAVGITEEYAKNYLLWVSVEPVLRRIFGCSFLPYHDYGKGGRGWRDLWQDCLALMLGDPSSVRDLLINNFAGVRADGTNATIIGSKPGEFIADRNGIARVWMDHGVWTWITMKLYMELSGDSSVLDTEQYYFKDRLCMRAKSADERSGEVAFGVSPTLLLTREGKPYRGSLFEHMLLMHITVALDVGEHGNMLLRGADWNDALDMADKKGESVAFTAAYAGNLREMAQFLEDRGGSVEILKELAGLAKDLCGICSDAGLTAFEAAARKRELLEEYCRSVSHDVSGEKTVVDAKDLAATLRAISDSVAEHIRKNEILVDNGFKWINGYYDNDGKPVESIKDGRIMLTGAVFAIMSGVAQDSDIKDMVKTADKYLFCEASGGYRLNTRFEDEEKYAHKLGRMFGFAYGTKENGAVFCHMAVMYAYSLLSRGFKDEALKVVSALISASLDFDRSHIYPGIPEYFDNNGRGMYPYLTGAASWMLLLMYRLAKS